ncbi:MAG: hypothetical protein PWP21_343 [Thermosediminibacterales bacterium]|nr:hypothetical protein [Thermosediminibacterales bacterium]
MILVFIASFIIVFSKYGQESTIPKPPIDFNDNVSAEETQKNPKITKDTKIIFETYYEKCGNLITDTRYPKSEEIGMDKKQISVNYPDWVVIDFSAKEVRLKRMIDDYCPNKFYIGVKDGKIALFHGNKENPILVEKTNISIDFLKDEDKRLLEKGIPIKNIEEFLKIREGFSN